MLSSITLENFKAFQKLDNLNVKPITILCGTNSCGKSSILQSILLLKQTLESKNPNQNLLLNGRFVKLGYFQDVIYKKDFNNVVSFDFVFNILPQIKIKNNHRNTPIDWLLWDMIGNDEAHGLHEGYKVDYKVSLKSNYILENSETEYLKSTNVEHICLKISLMNNPEKKPEITISVSHIRNESYKVVWNNLRNRFRSEGRPESGEIEVEIKFANLLPVSFKLPETVSKRRAFSDIDFTLFRLNELLQSIFKSYSYVGPLREEPAKRYVYEDEVVEIGNKGENAAYLYLTEQSSRLENHYFYNYHRDGFEILSNQTLHSALQKWFELMKINAFEVEIINKIIYLNLNANSYDNTRVGIADVGFGVSQIFPIILEGLRIEKGGTLLLEQPEIHLHPNLQMQMADYFISLALSGKKIIVETHSDHIINRLVRRIVEDNSFNLKNMIGIYFIKPSVVGSVYEEIKIDETQGIINWPTEFFDQTANEQLRTMQAGLKKRKKVKPIN